MGAALTNGLKLPHKWFPYQKSLHDALLQWDDSGLFCLGFLSLQNLSHLYTILCVVFCYSSVHEPKHLTEGGAVGGAEREDIFCGLIFAFLKAAIDLGYRDMASRSLEMDSTGKGGR